MATTRSQLEAELTRLDEQIPALQRDHPDVDDFWAAFAGATDFATESAGADDMAWINERIDALLVKHGIAVRPDESPVDG